MWPGLGPLALKSNRCCPLVIRRICDKFGGPSWNGSVFIVFTRFNNNFKHVTLTHELENKKVWSSLWWEVCLAIVAEMVQSVLCLIALWTDQQTDTCAIPYKDCQAYIQKKIRKLVSRWDSRRDSMWTSTVLVYFQCKGKVSLCSIT